MIDFKTSLLPYQQAAVDKLSKIKVGALYMEQGTGKTRTTLSLIENRLSKGKAELVLWLCPCSVKANLKEDIKFHCGSLPQTIVIKGIESLSSSDRLYMQLMSLVQQYKVFLVVDESNLVKNKMAIRTNRIIELSKHCQYKIILNGTPISKNEADLFAQWYILDWRILGYKSYWSFAANHLEYYTVKLPNGTEIVDKNRIKRVLNVDYLTEKIEPYTFQIKKEECLTLPPKTYHKILFQMGAQQEEAYQDVKERYLLNIDEFKSETIYKFFAALQHVSSGRNVVSDPNERMKTTPLYSDPRNNPRIAALLHALEGNTEKVIIFCKYQTEINDLMTLLPDSVEFTGRLSNKKRQENRELFRREKKYLIANRACGAYGLNLQFCHKIIFYNNDFDLATRLQAEDRVHRIGQTHNVDIVDICAFDTIDIFISDCLAKKENLAESFKRWISRNQKGGFSGKDFSRKECV